MKKNEVQTQSSKGLRGFLSKFLKKKKAADGLGQGQPASVDGVTGDRDWWTRSSASAGRGREKDEEAGNNSISQANEYLRQSVSRLYDLQFPPPSSDLQSLPIATNQQQLQQQQPIREEGGAKGKRKSKSKEAKVKDRSFDTFSELAASNRLPSAPVTFLTDSEDSGKKKKKQQSSKKDRGGKNPSSSSAETKNPPSSVAADLVLTDASSATRPSTADKVGTNNSKSVKKFGLFSSSKHSSASLASSSNMAEGQGQGEAFSRSRSERYDKKKSLEPSSKTGSSSVKTRRKTSNKVPPSPVIHESDVTSSKYSSTGNYIPAGVITPSFNAANVASRRSSTEHNVDVEHSVNSRSPLRLTSEITPSQSGSSFSLATSTGNNVARPSTMEVVRRRSRSRDDDEDGGFSSSKLSATSVVATPQPTVVHYHLSIKNCDGLSIHVHGQTGRVFATGPLTVADGDVKRLSWVDGPALSTVSPTGTVVRGTPYLPRLSSLQQEEAVNQSVEGGAYNSNSRYVFNSNNFGSNADHVVLPQVPRADRLNSRADASGRQITIDGAARGGAGREDEGQDLPSLLHPSVTSTSSVLSLPSAVSAPMAIVSASSPDVFLSSTIAPDSRHNNNNNNNNSNNSNNHQRRPSTSPAGGGKPVAVIQPRTQLQQQQQQQQAVTATPVAMSAPATARQQQRQSQPTQPVTQLSPNRRAFPHPPMQNVPTQPSTTGASDPVMAVLASIKQDLLRVPGVLVVGLRHGCILVQVSRSRRNFSGVARFMAQRGVPAFMYECEVHGWQDRVSSASSAAASAASYHHHLPLTVASS